jgi:purine-nucleoside phosphorylase
VTRAALDEAVDRALAALAARETAEPQALILLATGGATLATRLAGLERVPFAKVDGAPAAWRETTLYTGRLGDLSVWIVDDAPGAAEDGGREEPGEEPWTRGFPVLLSASAGASVLVHASAGAALASGTRIAPGSLAFVKDHVNLSGRTPLLALGSSQLGPLFPDTTELHHAGLRAAALRHARAVGVPAAEAIAACVAGPCLETPAERVFWARAGCDVAVQELQNPLLAAAHAGFAALAIVCVTDAGEGASDVRGIVQRADELAAALDDLLFRLAPDLAAIAQASGVDEP